MLNVPFIPHDYYSHKLTTTGCCKREEALKMSFVCQSVVLEVGFTCC